MLNNYRKFVAGQTMGKSMLISGHLWLEHLLVRSIIAVLQNPEALFKERLVSFNLLVSLCEAHGIIDYPLAAVLRRINTLRNKCAHQATYESTASDLNALRPQVREIYGDALSESDDPIEAVALLLENRARATGATDLEAIVPEIPDYVARHLEPGLVL